MVNEDGPPPNPDAELAVCGGRLKLLLVMHVTDLAVGAEMILETEVATIWLLDLAMFCCDEVNFVMDLWRPPLEGGRETAL